MKPLQGMGMHLNLMNAQRSRKMKAYQAVLIIISIIVTSFVTSQVYSFEGYDKHPMYGNSIFPLTDADIKLSEIKVLMIRKENDIATKVTSEYVLENQSKKEVKFEVAFPVDSNCLGCTRMPDDFKVSVNDGTIKTSTSKIMSKDFYSRIRKTLGLEDTAYQKEIYEIPLIMWEVSFKPKEKKTITIRYTMEWIGDPRGESLNHRLGALYLWKGKINKAYFRLELPADLIDNIKAQDPSIWPKITIDPKRYQVKDHAIEWFFKDLKQEKVNHIRISVNYRKPGVVGD